MARCRKHQRDLIRTLRSIRLRGAKLYHGMPDQSVRLSPTTYCARSALNDDVRGVLNRLLEREQTERVVDDTLTSFARIWIGLFVVLNLLAVILLQLAAPTLGSGLAKLLEFYSPINVATWIVEAVALSPALFAIFWKNQRLSRLCATPETTFYVNATNVTADATAVLELSCSVRSCATIRIRCLRQDLPGCCTPFSVKPDKAPTVVGFSWTL